MADTRENLARAAGSARRGRQADPPPAAPGQRRAPLPGPQDAGAHADRRTAGAAAARARQRRGGAGQRGARVRTGDAAGAGGPALGRSGDRAAARVPWRAERRRRRGCRAAITSSAPRSPAPRRASAIQRELRERARSDLSQVERQSRLDRAADRARRGAAGGAARRDCRARAAGRGAARERAAGRERAGSGGGASWPAWQQRWESFNRELGRRRAERPGRVGAHRAAGEPAASAAGAGRPAEPRARRAQLAAGRRADRRA